MAFNRKPRFLHAVYGHGLCGPDLGMISGLSTLYLRSSLCLKQYAWHVPKRTPVSTVPVIHSQCLTMADFPDNMEACFAAFDKDE